MKTAISIPDGLFAAAEAQAKQEKVTRSELYAKAMANYLKRRRDEGLTEELNEALEGIDQTPDPAWEAAQIAALKRSEWK